MKTEWKANSTDPDDLTGVGTFIFPTNNVSVAFHTFTHFHTLVTLIDREIQTAVWNGRLDLKNQIASIAI